MKFFLGFYERFKVFAFVCAFESERERKKMLSTHTQHFKLQFLKDYDDTTKDVIQ